MKLFRLRFILLGLLLCLCHVWCLTCGTEFDDAATSAYLADVVVIGTLTQKLPPVNSLYNATVTVSKSRNVLKGANTLRELNLLRRGGGSSLLTVGQFGVQNAEYCFADVDQDMEYIFFLRKHLFGSTFNLSAMPISEENKRTFKRAKKDIKKILCGKKKCVKLPEFDSRKMMKDLQINAGKKIELNCRLQRKPLPNAVFTWLKNDKDVNTLNNKRLRIKTSKKGSRLSIRRASPSDSGLYKCIARNIGGDVSQEADVIVSHDAVTRPVAGDVVMEDVQQQIGSTLRLTCTIKYQTVPEAKFRWQKDGYDIRSDDGFVIRSKASESKLRKTNLLKSDQGIYKCIAENKGGKLEQHSNVSVYLNPSVTKPQAAKPYLKDKNQKYGDIMMLVCKVKERTTPATTFRWEKDGKQLNTGDKSGLVIQSKGDESTLIKSPALLSDQGLYSCIAENSDGKLNQSARITVIDGPIKEVPCDPKDQLTFCLNNGTCSKYSDIDEKFCKCPKEYEGLRCEQFTITRKIAEGEGKLAQDRAFVIVGIISGILLFIGICVASYFLAKRRRDRFHRRRNQQRVNGHIEDIPQVYRPLIGCDDIDGLTKKMNGVLIHKETQTTESCFLGDNTALYISPVEGYVRNDGGNDRGSRSRKAAVSLEEDPRNWVNRNNSHNDSMNDNDNKNFGEINNLDNRGDTRENDLNVDSDHLNDLSPRHKPIQRESEPTVGANPHVANIPSPKSTLPPAINLDTSDEEIPGDGTPLTPLHISEDEDNSDIFKKCKPKTADGKSKSDDDNLFKKCKPKNINEPEDETTEREPEPKPQGNPRPHARPEKASNLPGSGRHDRPPHMNIGRQGNPHPHKSNRPGSGDRRHNPKSGPPPNMRRRDNNPNPGKHPHRRDEHGKGPSQRQPPPPKESNTEISVASPENNTAVSTNGLTDIPPSKPAALTVPTNKPEDRDSDSSSSTEGCDSPNTAWINSQEFSDHSPEPPRAWNERGSPEGNRKNVPPYFNLFPKKGEKGSGARSGDRRDEDGRNNKMRPIKDKFSIAI